MDTLEPQTTYLPITPPYEYRDITQAMFEHPIVPQTNKDSRSHQKPSKIAWMMSPETTRFDDDFSESSSDSEKSIPESHPFEDDVDLSLPSKMRFKHQDAVSAIMSSHTDMPLKSAVAIANGLGRYGRKTVVPRKSPTDVTNGDLVFQLDMVPETTPQGVQCRSKVISGESLLMALKRRVTAARQINHHHQSSKRMHQSQQVPATRIWLPKTASPIIHKKYPARRSEFSATQPPRRQPSQESMSLEEYDEDRDDHSSSEKSDSGPRERQPTGQFKPHATSPKSTKPKGPCQACQEHSEGCMRKAFDWPLTDGQIYYDKGRPFVYLCNKCGLRYNKSNGCVCRNCKWVLCKEDKRKAMQFIDAMRVKRPGGYLDPDEDIEGFLCPPKYWKCNQAWKVGWVLQN